MKSLGFLFHLALASVASAAVLKRQDTTITLEAEDAVLSGGTVVATDEAGFSGTPFFFFFFFPFVCTQQ